MRIRSLVKAYREVLLDLLYPSKTLCYFCGGPLEEGARYSLCLSCYRSLPLIPAHSCRKCSKALRMLEDGPTCQDCQQGTYFFDRALAVVRYEGDMKKYIHRFKYSGHTYLAKPLGQLMAQGLREEGLDIHQILPVPLHPARERERGFNQAYLLAKYISEATKIPVEPGSLIRIKNTKAMHQLSKKERQENVKDAFKLGEEGVIVNQNILLVDDIFTTGSTVNVCSRILKMAGAKSVTVITFARD